LSSFDEFEQLEECEERVSESMTNGALPFIWGIVEKCGRSVHIST